MARPSIEPVTDATLGEFASFLHANLEVDRSAPEWEASLRRQWAKDAGNFGFVLRDGGKIVGGIGAYYADRTIRGHRERTCNMTSWCVVEAYRQHSMRLAMALLSQSDCHFTNFSPTKVVGSTLKFLKFVELEERVAVVLNLPALPRGRVKILAKPAEIESALDGEALRVYRDHSVFPWLSHVLVGRPGQWCHVIYKRRRFKGMLAAYLIHASDPTFLAEHFRAFASYLLRHRMVSTHVELRCMPAPPWPSVVRSGFTPKLFLSPTLEQSDIDYLYSETVALDL